MDEAPIIRADAHEGSFVRTLVFNLIVAIVAYLSALAFVFPGYIAPLAPFHSDQYLDVNAIPMQTGLAGALNGPRPIGAMLAYLGGRLGLEASIAIKIAFAVLMLALSLSVCESYFLKKRTPWFVAYATFVLAMSAPSFYFSAGYDPGNIALLVAILGVIVWERRSHGIVTWLLATTLFTASALVKESTIPALVVYAIAVSIRDFRSSGVRSLAIIAAPLVAGVIVFGYGIAIHSSVTTSGIGGNDSYSVGLGWNSLLTSLRYYVSPLWNWPCVVLLLNCMLGIWLHRRWSLGAVVIALSFALLVPYLVLPNHLLGYYFWVPWPILMLLIPLAWNAAPLEKDARAL